MSFSCPQADLSDQFFNTLGPSNGFDFLLEDPAFDLSSLLPDFKLSEPDFATTTEDISVELEELNSLPGFQFPATNTTSADMTSFSSSAMPIFDVCLVFFRSFPPHIAS
jgi:hypothetical protein